MISVKHEINYCWWLLRLMFGITFIGAGLDKFFDFVTSWGQFYTPLVGGMSVSLVLYFVSIIELALGLLIFTRWVQVAALLITIWMIGNGIYLLFLGVFLDTGFRFISLGICALVLFHLTRVRFKLLHS